MGWLFHFNLKLKSGLSSSSVRWFGRILKTIKGRGYVDVGENVISEFYTPLVSAGYDFLKEIGKHTKYKGDAS